MLTIIIKALRSSRTFRPLVWWILCLLAYVAFPVTNALVLPLIIGLGAAATLTFMRLRGNSQQVIEQTQRGWTLAERLTDAAEHRIRGHVHRQLGPQAYQQLGAQPFGQLPGHGSVAVYDPGALLDAVAAVLAAEGIPVDAAPALPVCVHLLADQGIAAGAGVLAATATGLTGALRAARQQRPYRAMPPTLLAAVIQAVLTNDSALSAQLTPAAGEQLVADTAALLWALGIQPDDRAGGLESWPIIAHILHAAPQLPPHQIRQW